MHENKKKVTFSGSLAWRTSIVCLVFLIAPLLVHTFLLYRQEIRVAESGRVYELQAKPFLFRIVTFLALVVLLGGALVFFLVRRLGKPLRALCLTMKRVAEGATHSRYVPQWWGFEINSIGLMFNEALDEVISRAQEAEEEKMKRVRLAEELKLGREIQMSLLPKQCPTIQDLEISAGCIPAHEVGGDFYDIFPLGHNETLVAVADVAGKGISACLFSVGLRSSLRALAANVDSLPEIVRQANELFLSDVEPSSNFATLWIGRLEKRTLSFISLGHPPALLKREGRLQELTTQYPALGAMPYGTILASSIDLEPGDEILIFSDGATDAMDIAGNRFGIGRLRESFLRSTNGATELLKQIEFFSQGALPEDDLTLLFLKILM